MICRAHAILRFDPTKGLGGLDAIFAQFNDVIRSGYFEFRLVDSSSFDSHLAAPAHLRLVYAEHGHKRALESEGLIDFEHRLGFVQLRQR